MSLTVIVRPGRLGAGQFGWQLQCQVKMYFWLGLAREMEHFWAALPEGFSDEIFPAEAGVARPPTEIVYPGNSCFEFRAYLFAARNLIGSDDSGLSDAFARIIVKDQVAISHTVPQSLSPCWDRTLTLSPITFHVSASAVQRHPPAVIVEVFDDDAVGSPDFLGRSICTATIHLSATAAQLQPPVTLKSWRIFRGQSAAGNLLAAFQLIELPPGTTPTVGNVANDMSNIRVPVPSSIRPKLLPYRVELLLWGLRNVRRVQLQSVRNPRLTAEFGGVRVRSDVIQDFVERPNFDAKVLHLDLQLPVNQEFWPPLMFQCEDCRQFGRIVLIGNCIVPNVQQFVIRNQLDIDDELLDDAASTSQILSVIEPALDMTGGDGAFDNFAFSEAAADSTTLSLQQQLLDSGENRNDEADAAAATAAGEADEKSSESDLSQNDTVAVNSPQMAAFDFGNANADAVPGSTIELNSEIQKPRGTLQEQIEVDWWSRFYASIDDGDARTDNYDTQHSSSSSIGYDSGSDADPYSDIGEGSDVDQQLIVEDIPEFSAQSAQAKRAAKKEANRVRRRDKKKKKQKKRRLKQLLLLREAKKFFTDAEEENQGEVSNPKRNQLQNHPKWINKLQVYRCQLEQVNSFNNFQTTLRTFHLLRGKQLAANEDEEEDEEFSRRIGIFKGNARIYRINEIDFGNEVNPNHLQLHSILPVNDIVSVIVRIYVVRCLNLQPADPNGKADPYLVLRLGEAVINEKENYIPKQLNPIFGKCFEFNASFPHEAELRLAVMDWDLLSGDDLIGETVIDLENRFFSLHRATCGLPLDYSLIGSSKWRDQQSPSSILARLCRNAGMEEPKYEVNSNRVLVGGKYFYCDVDVMDELGSTSQSAEPLALKCLHNWSSIAGPALVPEHVESRSLYSPDKPGIEQGKVQMWIDMFPKELGQPPAQVDISPRLPEPYELRVIVWDTADVVLDDVGIMGAASSDIFVKGWVLGCGVDEQETDVHYRSLTGEGNFNWRLIFPLNYLKAEDKVVYKHKESFFSIDEEEKQAPCQLHLQVWDADIVSADDFLGGLQLTLSRMPRGAKSAKSCGLFQVDADQQMPTLSLFRNRRCRGWWPFAGEEEGEPVIVGKADLELQLLTAAEAEASPAGLGRSEPMPLPEPKRPETSFNWMFSPLKTLKFLIWEPYKWRFLAAIIIICFAAFFVLFMYSAPGYFAKRIIGA